MSNPLVSVLMPVYNASKYLKEAIESILDQDFNDFEFLITDDGSTDRSLEILESYARKDRRIYLASQGNMGLANTLNKMLSRAKGDFIARMDADDIAFPERLSKQVTFLQNRSEYIAVGSRILVIDPTGLPICLFSQKTTHEEIDAAYMSGQTGVICHPAVMMRRWALLKVGGYRKEMEPSEDRDLFLRLAEVGKLANLPDTLLKYRLHLKSVSHLHYACQRSKGNLALKEACLRRGVKLTPDIVNDAEGEIPEHKSSIGEIHCRWAWWALKAGYIRTARKHALQALAKNPLALTSWQVLACTIRGY